ncbi:MAG: hypothetical protein GX369_07160 [Euryarchaeota archaeon]|nr:hypothetical protein [Euryarchaeota archaeon]
MTPKFPDKERIPVPRKRWRPFEQSQNVEAMNNMELEQFQYPTCTWGVH